MKIKYDQEVDVLRILWGNDPIEESDEEQAGVILDYNEQGKVIGLEILQASEQVDDWKDLEGFLPPERFVLDT
ncbi:Protein of unknown function DUF2283 [Halothece sp. PCC 7418]|uniref:DUF2283 domain-containing protein n=1 Tax=Halothece sp. (strain PCC 7418) TaxID=65093 RepID=UPI0002A0731C|nr:DUF2283 domain-containing protein [Halothece sp. PCC 7418]AFZ42313.1 Protein of unknown function DUF2283 [Halothece sp. PCC 7418]